MHNVIFLTPLSERTTKLWASIWSNGGGPSQNIKPRNQCQSWLWLTEIVNIWREENQTIGRHKLNVSFLRNRKDLNLIEPWGDQMIQKVDLSLRDSSSEMEDVYNKAYMLE